jgi:polyhydroxyalkanoate synthase
MTRAFIASTGSYLPGKIIPNEDLLQFSREARSLIGKKTGVLARHHAGENQCTSDLALEAVRTCLEKIDFLPADIEGIILSTSSPDRIQPATATRVQHLLGAKRSFAFDINSVCSGSVYGLHLADVLVKSGQYGNILFVAAEAYSRFLNSKDFSTFPYCGDGAGAVLLQGTEDFSRGDSLSRITDEKAFKVGENIAITPGFVVFRNDLMELIQYEASTATTHALPIVLVPPWINKYYIFDLTPQTSFVRFLRDQGFTVFVISWKNPTAIMREVTFADYMFSGALKAVEGARHICIALYYVHAAGYCIGGTALAAFMAWLNRGAGTKGHLPIADWTLFSTLVDFSEPGDLGVFMSEKSIETTEIIMKADGFLDACYLSWLFRVLGSDSLIWRNFVQNYLYGGTPPKSDLLSWNSDSTRLPEAMCSFYLREFYLHNNLAKKDVLSLGNRPMDMERVGQPLYAVGAQLDHICPWRGTFRACSLVQDPRRYILASGGHIPGIINPHSEGSRRKFWAGKVESTENLDNWLSRQEERRGSWWRDWTDWLVQRGSIMKKPPTMGCVKYPPRERSPGKYVTEN